MKKVKDTTKKLEILVVERSKSERKALSEVLLSLGHDVETAADGKAAINKLRRGRFDITFLAWDLPKLGSLEVIDEIREFDLDTAAIISADKLSASDATKAIRRGAYDYIVKPVPVLWLEVIIYRALERRRVDKLRGRSLDDLLKTGRFYRDILENIWSGIWATDSEDKVIYFNKAMENISGVKRMRVLGENFFKRFSATLKRTPELAKHYKKAKDSLEIIHYDSIRITHKARKSIQSGVMCPLIDDVGEFEGMIVTVEDITDRKKAEAALKEALARFEAAIEQTPLVAIQGYNRKGRIQHWNRASEVLSGFKKGKVVGKRLQDLLLSGDEAQDFERGIKAVWESGKPSTAQEWRIKTKSGETRWVYSTMFPIFSRNEVVEIFCMDIDITVRKKAEEALRYSEERYRAIFDQAADAIVLIDVETGALVEFNKSAYENLGYTRKEFKKLGIADLEILESAEKVTKHIDKIAREGSDYFTTKHRKKNGSIRDIQVDSKLISLHGRHFIQSIWRDITESEKAKEEIENLAKFPSENPYPVLRIAKDGIVLYANAASLSLLSDRGTGIGQLVPDDWRQLIVDVLRSGSRKNIEIEHRNRVFSFGVVPVTDAAYVNLYGSDITERKKAEDGLALSKQWYQTIFDSANDAFFIHDPQTAAILGVNERMCEMFGYTKEEARELTIGQISSGEHPFTQEEAAKWLKMTCSSGPQLIEWMALHKDGHIFPTEVNLKRALIGGKERVLAIVRDTTVRKELEKELIHAEKMAGIGQLAAGIAHEFNNFLAMISGYAQLAKAGTLEDKEKAIDVAEKVSERAKVVVKNLISFAREDMPDKKPTDIAEILEEALAPLSTQTKRQRITVKRHYSPVPMVHCDSGQIRQVFFNIILNAIQAMVNGGDLVVRIYAEDDEVIIKTTDTGYGIPDEILDKIFDPFVTTKGAIAGGELSGSGLGLSVSYGLIKEHGGDIVAENNADRGATFTISLPALPEMPHAETRTVPIKEEREEGPPQAKAKIMVIDDEEVILDLLTDILKKRGKHVTAIKDPQLALPILRRESYEIIFLDLVMPGHRGGLDLFREIKKISHNARIVLLTGKEIDEEVKAILEEGKCDFISKPFSVHEINSIVEAAPGKRST